MEVVRLFATESLSHPNNVFRIPIVDDQSEAHLSYSPCITHNWELVKSK